jgi:hypothetical protein
MRFIFLILLQISIFAADYDCVVVGTSPFSLFEALYQSHSGKKVLVLEEAAECGGAWKGINVCGVMHADLGCHQIGHDVQLKTFLEEYAGCKIVSMDNPLLPFEASKSPNGWYFSRGCYELIENLLKLIEMTDIVLLTEHKAENVIIDAAKKIATVQTKSGAFTTTKLIVTPMSCVTLNPTNYPQQYGKSKYYHLYLLVQDPTPPKFSYQGGVVSGASRMMNLTHFVGLTGTGRHLIVVQTHSEQALANGQVYLDGLKKSKLVDPSAYILKSEPYIYEAGSFHQGLISQMGAQGIIEVLQTGHFQSLATYIPKWKQALKPYNQAVR